MSGQIDYATFEKFAKDFYTRSQRLLDDWQLHKSSDGEQVYLVKFSIHEKNTHRDEILYFHKKSIEIKSMATSIFHTWPKNLKNHS